MSDWLLNLPVIWMSLVVFGATYLFAAALYALITALATTERAGALKAISPGMLPPLATVFALLVGFLGSQVWSEADRANTAVNREASALRAVVLIAAGFPPATQTQMCELVRRQIQDAATKEWRAMAHADLTLSLMPTPLVEALQMALSFNPQNQGQSTAQREIVGALQTALDARRQRIILSRSSLNWVKWSALLLQAILTLTAIAIVHSDNRAANRIILTIFATSVAAAVVLIAAHSQPFKGELSVSPSVLLQVMPEATSPPAS